MARYIISGLLIFTLQIGCAHHKVATRPVVSSALPAADAPTFNLVVDGKPAVSTVSHRFEPTITIVDRRDALQKKYYRGESDPHRWRDAVTILPMESFQPGFDKQLERTIVSSLKDSLQYPEIEVTVRSFYATLDMRRQTEERFLYNFKEWDDDQDVKEQQRIDQERRNQRQEDERRRMNRELGLTVNGEDEDNGVGSKIVAGLFDGLVVNPMRERSRRKARAQRLTAAPQSLPAELVSGSREGWNCHLEIGVKLQTEDGQSRTVFAQVDHHLSDGNDSPTETQSTALIMSALKDVQTQLRNGGI